MRPPIQTLDTPYGRREIRQQAQTMGGRTRLSALLKSHEAANERLGQLIAQGLASPVERAEAVVVARNIELLTRALQGFRA